MKWRNIYDKAVKNRFVLQYRADVNFRVRVTLMCALAMNIAYAVFHLALALHHRTVWYGAFAVYYTTMSVIRFVLFGYTGAGDAQKSYISEIRRYRLCGFLLAFLHSALLAVVFSIAVRGMEIRHHEITTIAMAAYTFLSLTLSIIGLVKYKKYQSPIYSATKAVGLASSLVSVLILQTAMLTVFGGKNEIVFRKAMTVLTGVGVVLVILVMAVLMIIKSYRKNEVTNGKQQ